MRTLITYPGPTGGRALVLVPVDDEYYPFMLLDAPAGGPLAGADCRIVDHALTTEAEAHRAAAGYMLDNERAVPPPLAA